MNRVERDNFQMFVGVAVIGLYTAMVFALLFFEMPQGNKETLILLIGVLSGSFKDIVGWAFGSSKGSSDKTELMAAEKST